MSNASIQATANSAKPVRLVKPVLLVDDAPIGDVTTAMALEALESLDDCALMSMSVSATGPLAVLRVFIEQAGPALERQREGYTITGIKQGKGTRSHLTYAHARGPDGELIVPATLSLCADRITDLLFEQARKESAEQGARERKLREEMARAASNAALTGHAEILTKGADHGRKSGCC